MEMPIMYHPHMPHLTLPKPTMPTWLRSAYVTTAPKSGPITTPPGTRPVPPTMPPIVTESGVPGPGSRSEGVQYGGTTAMPAYQPMSPEEQAKLVRNIPNPWGWPPERIPRSAQEREEKSAYDSAYDETTRALPGQNVDEMRALLKQLEAAVGSPDLTNAQNAQVQGMIDALRKWLSKQAPTAPKAPAPVQPPTPQPAPAVQVGGVGHVLPWAETIPMSAGFEGFYVAMNAIANKFGTGAEKAALMNFGRAVLLAHKAGDFYKADDLLQDALANSDPKFAQALRDIEQIAQGAEPAAKPAAGFAGRPTR